uniref:Uncharacterized protein n=1 Tax=Myotis myotis TaxID=51298 RepID=A0A7J7SC69_MYOMY|nr:hypothetical protein mMyoMyo1_009542 [Myotis myotis]
MEPEVTGRGGKDATTRQAPLKGGPPSPCLPGPANAFGNNSIWQAGAKVPTETQTPRDPEGSFLWPPGGTPPAPSPRSWWAPWPPGPSRRLLAPLPAPAAFIPLIFLCSPARQGFVWVNGKITAILQQCNQSQFSKP